MTTSFSQGTSLLAFWRGREAERTPEIRRALFERRGGLAPRSEVRSRRSPRASQETRRDVHRQEWFWALQGTVQKVS